MSLMVHYANTGTAEEGLACPILLFPPSMFQYKSNVLNTGGERVQLEDNKCKCLYENGVECS